MRKVIFIMVAACLIAGPSWGDDQPSGLTSSEGFVDVDGGKIWYRVVGSGERTPLLLVNGGPGVSSVYLAPLEALAEDQPVIFYDQLGCGKSSEAPDTTLWQIKRFVSEIGQLREALGLDEIHLYGHSWGTMLATDYVLNRPEGVKSLILASPVLSVPRWCADSDSLLGTLHDSVQKAIRRHENEQTYDAPEYQAAIMAYNNQYFLRLQVWPEDVVSAVSSLNEEMYRYMWGPADFTITGPLSTYDRTDRLGEITVPTLLTAGEYDQTTPSTVRYYQSLIPGAKFELLQECAHFGIHEDPEADLRIIREFLAEVESD